MVKMSPKLKCFLALYSVGLWGGIPPAFENTSHDRDFPNKKSVIDVVFTEIGPIHYPTLNGSFFLKVDLKSQGIEISTLES